MKRFTTLVILLLTLTMGVEAQKPMKAPKGGKAISDELIGIFFEDISSSADGGLYAELLQNGSFEFNPTERDGWGPGTAWRFIRPGHSLGRIEPRMDHPLNANNPTYIRVYIERVGHYYDYDGWTGVGMENNGFDGISLKAGQKYDFSAFFRNVQGDAKEVRVALVQPQGWGKSPKALAEATFNVTAGAWQKFSAQLACAEDCQNADSRSCQRRTGC